MKTNGDGCGVKVRTVLKSAEMEAFDSLPKSWREVIANASIQVCALDFREGLLSLIPLSEMQILLAEKEAQVQAAALLKARGGP